VYTESEIQEAQEAIARQIRMAELALAEAKRLAGKYDLPFNHQLIDPVQAETDDWCSSHPDTSWYSSSQSC
jgi:hypothetical protein